MGKNQLCSRSSPSDQTIRLYDCAYGAFRKFRSIKARDVGWSVLDIAFTPDGAHFLYSSWSDYSEYGTIPTFVTRQEARLGLAFLAHGSKNWKPLFDFAIGCNRERGQQLQGAPFLSPSLSCFLPPSVHICNIYGESDTHTALDLR